jgi:uncharacterized protein (DUF58 family)
VRFAPLAWIRRPYQRLITGWLDRRVPLEAPHVRLHRRRLYILPSRLGWVFAAMLLALLLGSVNYETSLGFGATFLLAGLGVTGMIRTYRNLHGVELRFGPAPAAFAGDPVRFPVSLDGGRLERWALHMSGTRIHARAGKPPRQTHLALASNRRGRLRPGRLAIETTWPLGLFRVWSWVRPRVEAIVYPRPVDHGRPLPDKRMEGHGGARARSGDEDFAGLREYQPGDAPRRIAWKTFARRGELHTKRFEAESAGDRVLDWFELGNLAPEARLEQLTRWVLDAEARGESYALCLPGLVLDADRGPEHRARCLEALALHGEVRA